MKKRISAVLLSLLFSVACLGGCGKKTYELPWDQCCASIHPPRQITMNGEERKYLVDTLNGCEWTDGVSNCACDFVFYMQALKHLYYPTIYYLTFFITVTLHSSFLPLTTA